LKLTLYDRGSHCYIWENVHRCLTHYVLSIEGSSKVVMRNILKGLYDLDVLSAENENGEDLKIMLLKYSIKYLSYGKTI